MPEACPRAVACAGMAAAALVMTMAGCERPDSPAASGRTFPGNELREIHARTIGPADRLAPVPGDPAAPSGTRVEAGEETSEPAPPGSDWATEERSREVTGIVRRLLAARSIEALESGVHPRVRATSLRPESLLEPVGGSRAVRMRRADPERLRDLPVAEGPDALLAGLIALGEVRAPGEARDAVKVVAIEEGEEGAFSTLVRVELAGRRPAGPGSPLQVTAAWRCRWRTEAIGGEETPRLVSLALEAHEECSFEPEVAGRAPALYGDATAAVLGGVDHFAGQTLRSIDSWCSRITLLGQLYLTGHHGIAVGDVDGDGREDLYACDGGSLPNRLYLQQEDGTLRDASADGNADYLEDSRGALLIDLDGDGDRDLVVATVALLLFAENDGAGRFRLRGGHEGAPHATSLAAADYDGDGDLDVFACAYESDGSGGGSFFDTAPVPFHDATNGGRNVLLENGGGFRFADVAGAVGLGESTRWSLAAAWEDFDRDGDPDLYVANDFGRNALYRNDPAPGGGRRFTDVAGSLGVEDRAAGMSVAWGDADGDGRPDLYVGNMFSSAGRRISYQRHFAPGLAGEDRAGVQRMARGNSLFRLAETGFVDASEVAGVTMGRWAWSSGFADLDLDGSEDLVVANGFLTGEREDDL